MSKSDKIPTFDKNLVMNLENIHPKDALEKVDQDIFEAIRLFQKNRFEDALALVMKNVATDANHSIAASFMLFAKALTALDLGEVGKATDAFNLTTDVADAQNGKSGVLGSTSKELKWINKRSSAVTGTANCTKAGLYLMQASITNLIKAGLCIMKGIHTIESDYKSMDKIPKNKLRDVMDENTEGNLQLVIGAINIITGFLPPIILKFIGVFGYTSDLKLGYGAMHDCEQGNSFYGEMAPLFLLGFQAVRMGVAPGTTSAAVHDEMKTRLRKLGKEHSKFCIFLIIYNWFKRHDRNLKQSITILQKAVASKYEWKGIKCLVDLELLVSLLFSGDYKNAAVAATDLQHEEVWAQPFLAYCAAASKDMTKEAKLSSYDEARFMTNRRFIGRIIPPEQFAIKRIEYFNNLKPACGMTVDEIRRLHLPGLEVAFMFLGFAYKNLKQLTADLSLVEDALEKAKPLNLKSLNNHLNLMKFSLMRHINVVNKTYDLDLLDIVEDMEKDEINWIKPMSVLEQAHLHFDAFMLTKNPVYKEKTLQLFKETKKSSGYIYEYL